MHGNLYMRQVLCVCAHLILAFDDQNTIFTQYPVSFFARFEVKVKNCIVVFGSFLGWFAIGISGSECGIRSGTCQMVLRSPIQTFHIWWIEHHAINRAVMVW